MFTNDPFCLSVYADVYLFNDMNLLTYPGLRRICPCPYFVSRDFLINTVLMLFLYSAELYKLPGIKLRSNFNLNINNAI